MILNENMEVFYMNNKIFLGVLLVLMGLFFTIRQFIPDSIVRMFLNEQLVLF